MPELDDTKARSIAAETEHIYKSLIKVHRKVFRKSVASDPSIGTGRPNRAAEDASDLGRSFGTSSFDDPVFIGFWWPGGK